MPAVRCGPFVVAVRDRGASDGPGVSGKAITAPETDHPGSETFHGVAPGPGRLGRDEDSGVGREVRPGRFLLERPDLLQEVFDSVLEIFSAYRGAIDRVRFLAPERAES